LQTLVDTANVYAHLEDELKDNSQWAEMEGAKFIAKTAIGSGVVVWVMQISQVVAAFIAASSAWMHLDPLSILNASKDGVDSKDIAESLFDNKATKQ
jgi:hypothetical protein